MARLVITREHLYEQVAVTADALDPRLELLLARYREQCSASGSVTDGGSLLLLSTPTVASWAGRMLVLLGIAPLLVESSGFTVGAVRPVEVRPKPIDRLVRRLGPALAPDDVHSLRLRA